MSMQTITRIQHPKWSQDVFVPNEVIGLPVRYRVVMGGRGGSKSWEFARRLLLKAIQEPLTILCTRELQKSIKDSVHKLLVSQIEQMGLQDHFYWDKTHLRSHIGTEFIFLGLRYNADEVKSLEGVDICWLEEAQATTQNSLDMLIPTIRKPNSEIWITYNPKNEDDPVHQMFIIEGRENAIVKHINFDSNPWFPAVLDQERRTLEAINPKLYRRVWLGEIVELGNGDYFPTEKVNIIESIPTRDILFKVRAWDLAATEPSDNNPDPDYTSGVLMGITKDKRIIIIDVISKQLNASDVRKLVTNTAMMDGKKTFIRMAQDPAQAGKDQVESYKRMLRRFKVASERITGSKEARSEALSAEWHGGNVNVINGDWTNEYLKTMNSFPYKKMHDDSVDASNDAYSELIKLSERRRSGDLMRSLYMPKHRRIYKI